MIFRWLLAIFLNGIALMLVDHLFKNLYIQGFGTALIASFLLSVINTFIKPVLVFFTLPITLVTLGLFLLVINAATLMLTQLIMGSSFVIEGFFTALFASIFISLINMFLNRFVESTVR